MALGQWTFNRAFRGVEGVTRRDSLEFPTLAGELGFEGVDYSGILLGEHHDRYAGVAAMLPFAKCVCAKTLDFDANGDECYSDYGKLLKQVADSGYRGWIEVEFEGPGHAGGPAAERNPARPLTETDGCLATKRLLEKLLGADLGKKS